MGNLDRATRVVRSSLDEPREYHAGERPTTSGRRQGVAPGWTPGLRPPMPASQMLSFSQLGRHCGLGNQLFQYAFVRTAGRRLGVPFHCPPWLGDQVFALDDAAERVARPHAITRTYVGSPTNCGFDEAAMRIEDGTEAQGFFQSERYWIDNQDAVRTWFSFLPTIVRAAERRYGDVDLGRSTSLHVRFGDMERLLKYYRPGLRYYRDALDATPRHATVLVFSDEIPKARALLRTLQAPLVFVEGNAGPVDLCLMSRCHDQICSPSTFSWWGAWLNPAPDKVVVVPREGALRPGYPTTARDFWPERWTAMPALRGLVDDYRVWRPTRTLGRVIRRLRRRPPPRTFAG